MNQILLTKVIPPALTASGIILLFLLPDEGELWFCITAGVLFALNGLIFIWMRLRKAPNLRITEDAVFVCGLKMDRRDILRRTPKPGHEVAGISYVRVRREE